jgi:hypothetical protein
VPHRLEYFRQRRDQAREQAANGDGDRAAWGRLAAEWQKLLEAVAAELAEQHNSSLDEPKPH